MKTVSSALAHEYNPRINNLRGSRVSRRADIRNSNRTPPVIRVHDNQAPDEIIEVLRSQIEPSALPHDSSSNSNSNDSIEIIYEELAPSNLYEIVSRPRIQSRAPELIELDNSEDSTDEDNDSSESRKTDSPMLLDIEDLDEEEIPLEQDSPSPSSSPPSTPSTIGYSPSPSPDYSPVMSPGLEIQVNEISSSGISDDTILGFFDSISDEQILDLMREFNDAFSSDNEL